MPAAPLGFFPDDKAWAALTATTFGLTVGTNVQAYDPTLTAFAAVVGSANKIAYFTALDTFALADFTVTGRTLAGAADAAAGRTALALGTAAVNNVGTVGSSVPMNNTANIFSALQTLRLDVANAPSTPLWLVNGATSGTSTEVIIDMTPGTNAIGIRSAQLVAYAISNSQAGLKLRTANANLPSDALTLTHTNGAFIGNTTGGDKGANTFNAMSLWEAGVAISAKYQAAGSYGQLAVANTWTASQTISLSNPALVLNKTAGTTGIIDFQSVGSLRWRIQANNTAEGGANAGTDLQILSRTDAGGALATPVSIERATGIVTFAALPVAAGYQMEVGGYNARASDADFTLTVRSAAGVYEKFTGTLTAIRTVTLSTTGALAGDRFYITRTGGGAFSLNIGAGPLKALAQNQWCIVVYDGSAWYLAAFGSL